MFDLDLGSIFTGIQAVRDDAEREKLFIAVTSAIISGTIHAAWEIGADLSASRWSLWKTIGKALAHGALSTTAIFLTDSDLRKIYLALPRDLLAALPADIIVIRGAGAARSQLQITQPGTKPNPPLPADLPNLPTVDHPSQAIEYGG